jgi:hypothetical protein
MLHVMLPKMAEGIILQIILIASSYIFWRKQRLWFRKCSRIRSVWSARWWPMVIFNITKIVKVFKYSLARNSLL